MLDRLNLFNHDQEEYFRDPRRLRRHIGTQPLDDCTCATPCLSQLLPFVSPAVNGTDRADLPRDLGGKLQYTPDVADILFPEGLIDGADTASEGQTKRNRQ